MDVILKRRSIRSFTDQLVSKEQLLQVVLAGMSAPSAMDEQPWHFVVINQREVLDQLMQLHSYAEVLKNGASVILVCADLTLEKLPGAWIQDCAAAVQNMLLAATALNLGSLWMGLYPREDRVAWVRGLFKLPEQVVPFALVVVGYAVEEKPSKMQLNKERLHFNAW